VEKTEIGSALLTCFFKVDLAGLTAVPGERGHETGSSEDKE
jgi:hypothetical protein